MPPIRTLVSAILFLFLLSMVCAPAGAATLTVINTQDSGAGSLRAALASAASGDTIVFAPGVTGSVALLSTLSITQPVTIQGPGVANLTLDGQASVQVMAISSGGNLTLSGATIANGKTAGFGAGINIAGGGALTVSNCAFVGNEAANGGGIANQTGGLLSVDACTFADNNTTSVGGGALITSGSATVSNSTFLGNHAPINGGAVNIQGGGTLTLINSTLFNNSSGGLGGAMSSLGTVTIINSTFAANHGSSGSALATGNSNVTINNSVFADNVATGSPGALNIGGGTPTASNNVFFNNTVNGIPDDQTGYGTSSFIVATAEPLAALGNFGGPTQTMPPLPGGAAICAGSVALLPSGLTQDQRGFPRTSLGSCVDAGAVQITQTPAPVPGLSMPLLALLAGLFAMFGIRRLQYATR
jgi:hypothetical protein